MQKLAIAVLLLAVAVYVLAISGIKDNPLRIWAIIATVGALVLMLWAFASRGGDKK